MSQQGVDLSKKISKIGIFFLFDFHRCSQGPSKIRRHFRNKSCSILKLSKNVVLKWYSSVKKKFRKIRMIFDIENWLWKSDSGTLWQPMWTSVKVKSKKIFIVYWFFPQNLLRVDSRPQNSTTEVTLLFNSEVQKWKDYKMNYFRSSQFFAL